MADVIGHTYTIEYECGSGNDYDGRLGLRISSIFVIGFGSMLGELMPPSFIGANSSMSRTC